MEQVKVRWCPVLRQDCGVEGCSVLAGPHWVTGGSSGRGIIAVARVLLKPRTLTFLVGGQQL